MNFISLVVLLLIPVWAPSDDFAPMVLTRDIAVSDAEFEYGENNRKVPLRLYLPKDVDNAPVILFSHGLGGSKDNNPYLGKHWAGRGYAVVFLQHAGSDESVWRNVPGSERFAKLKSAANFANSQSRTKDVAATLNQLEKWNAAGEEFAGKFDLQNIGMSGHSFGAVTTQAVSGQNYGRRGQLYTDSRIKAAIAMSPSPPPVGNDSATFSKVKIPWLLMTGTKDKSVIARTTPEDRLKVFQLLPTNGRFYELVLHDAEHMAFSERSLLGREQRNPNHHKAILALSTAFWDAYLKNDQAAKSWLNSDSAKNMLGTKDSWRRK